jgi:hypothetical protein
MKRESEARNKMTKTTKTTKTARSFDGRFIALDTTPAVTIRVDRFESLHHASDEFRRNGVYVGGWMWPCACDLADALRADSRGR